MGDLIATTRAGALAQGLKTYTGGRACPHGHLAPRYASGGNCTACVEEQRRRNRPRYAEKERETAARYRHEKKAERAEQYRQWRSANPDDHRVREADRRARKLGVETGLTVADVEAITSEQNGRCKHCGANGRLTIDHVVPVTKGGPNVRTNIQMLCLPCNSRKGNR